MPGFQPRLTTDHVWYNGTDIHTYALATGLGIRITEIRGWDERPDVRDVREVRFQQHGEYVDNVFLGGRTITIQGVIHGSSWVNLQSRKRELAALFAPTSTEVLLKIPDPATASPTAVYATTGMTGYERTNVRPIESIAFGDMIGVGAMTFQVILRASDPRIYSDVATSTDSGTTGTASRTCVVDQAGTFETPPSLSVTGPTGSSWSITEPTSTLSLSMSGITLTSSDVVTFDTDDRTIDIQATYSRVRLLTGSVIAQWMLNETSGLVADNAQGTATYDGTYAGGVTLNQAGPASGIASANFDGVDDRVDITYNAALAPSALTFEIWVNADTSSAQAAIADFANTATNGWALLWELGGGFSVRNPGATSVQALNPPYNSTGTWYHVVVTLTASTICLYVNGTLVSSGAYAYTPPTAENYCLGRLSSGASPFDGKLAAATIYSGAFSASQVAELYAASAATTTLNGYTYLVATSSKWANLGTASSTFTLASSGLNTGSKLNVTYRDARL